MRRPNAEERTTSLYASASIESREAGGAQVFHAGTEGTGTGKNNGVGIANVFTAIG